MRLTSTLLFASFLVIGCPADDGGPGSASTGDDPTTGDASSSTEGATEPMLETDTGGPIPGCECIEDQDVDGDGMENMEAASPTCGDSLCPTVQACAGEECGDVEFQLDDPSALECALASLRDRTPGVLQWSFQFQPGYSEFGYILVNDDGTAVRRSSNREDLSTTFGVAALGSLATVEAYDACMSDTDDESRFDCLRAELASMLEICDEGFACPGCG